MEKEIIIAIISGAATVIAALIAGVCAIISSRKKAKHDKEQTIEGSGNIQAGNNVHIVGGAKIDVKATNKRK